MSDVDTNRFIIEVVLVVCDQERYGYFNKHLKFKAWAEVASAMYSGNNLNEELFRIREWLQMQCLKLTW